MTLYYHDNPIQLVIFDVDATLVDSDEAFLSCVRTVAHNHGLSLDLFNSYVEQVNRGDRLPVSPIANMAFHVWNHILPSDAFTIERHYKTMAREYTYRPMTHAVETMTKLRERGVRIAICSNESLEVATHRLDSIGLQLGTNFDAIKCAEGLLAKPNEMMALSLCTKLHTLPRKTLFVGDLVTDLLTARNAETEYAMVTTGFMDAPTLIRHGCAQDRIFKNLQSLAEFLAL